MHEVYEFLKEAKTYFLATMEGDQPRVRPLGTCEIFEEKLYIQMGRKKEVSKQLAINPKVEICAMSNGKWIRVSAILVDDDRLVAKEDMLEKNPGLKKMYQADDGNTQVLYLKDVVATIEGFGEPKKIIKF